MYNNHILHYTSLAVSDLNVGLNRERRSLMPAVLSVLNVGLYKNARSQGNWMDYSWTERHEWHEKTDNPHATKQNGLLRTAIFQQTCTDHDFPINNYLAQVIDYWWTMGMEQDRGRGRDYVRTGGQFESLLRTIAKTETCTLPVRVALCVFCYYTWPLLCFPQGHVIWTGLIVGCQFRLHTRSNPPDTRKIKYMRDESDWGRGDIAWQRLINSLRLIGLSWYFESYCSRVSDRIKLTKESNLNVTK